MNHFSYHSEQVHSSFQNGRGETRRNIVSIRDGKGTKAVETYKADGSLLQRNEKHLTQTELDCIQRNKFIPGLFKDCVKPLSTTSPKKKSSSKRKTQRIRRTSKQ